MIRTLAILLTAAVLLTFCGCGDVAPSADTDTTTTPTTETTTTQPDNTPSDSITTTTTAQQTVDEISRQQQEVEDAIHDLFSALKIGDAEALTKHTRDEAIAAMMADKVKVRDYTFTHYPTNDLGKIFWYKVHVTVERSELKSIPVGESDWWIGYGFTEIWYGIRMFPLENDPIIQNYLMNFMSITPLSFCYITSLEMKWFETISDVSALPAKTISENGGSLARICVKMKKYGNVPYDANGFVSADELSAFAEKTFGVKGVDFHDCPTYDATKDAVELSIYGDIWSHAVPLAVTNQGNRYTVDIRYYADELYLIEAVTMRYVVDETDDGYCLASCQKLSGTSFEPYWGAI